MGSSQHLYSAIERILCVFDWTVSLISNETFSWKRWKSKARDRCWWRWWGIGGKKRGEALKEEKITSANSMASRLRLRISPPFLRQIGGGGGRRLSTAHSRRNKRGEKKNENEMPFTATIAAKCITFYYTYYFSLSFCIGVFFVMHSHSSTSSQMISCFLPFVRKITKDIKETTTLDFLPYKSTS